jgi:hypothetical protein
MCVQRFNDSRDSAIHITYRISLRSSSMQEPRDPLLKVLFHFQDTKFRLYISQQVLASGLATGSSLESVVHTSLRFYLEVYKSYLQAKQSSRSNRVDKTMGYKKLR